MINNQGYLFIIFTIDGVLIGILFDLFRILRKSFKTKDYVTYIEDICFWIITGLIFLYSMIKFSDGELRFFMIIGILVGVSIYMITLSRFIIKISVFIINILKNILKNILYYPIKFIYNLIKKIIFRPLSIIYIKTTKNIKKICKKTDKKRGFFVKKEKYIFRKKKEKKEDI